MIQIHPYIHFNGNAEEAFTFYQSILGGTFTKIVRFSELNIPDLTFPEQELNKVMHIELTFGQNSVLMASDTPEFMGQHNLNENRSKLFVNTSSKSEADKIFNGLSVNGTIEMPIDDSPWGSYFGMFRDQYGIEWMISFENK